jgi:hypothetical protein
MTIPFDLEQMPNSVETYLIAARAAIDDALLNERAGNRDNALFYVRECLDYLDLLGVAK